MTAPPPPPPTDDENDDRSGSATPAPDPTPTAVPEAPATSAPDPQPAGEPQPQSEPAPAIAPIPEGQPAPAPQSTDTAGSDPWSGASTTGSPEATPTAPQPAAAPPPADPVPPQPADPAVPPPAAPATPQPAASAASAAPQPAAPPPEPAWPVEPPPQPTVLSAQPPPEPTVLTAQPPPPPPSPGGTTSSAAGQSVAQLNVDRATALTEEFLDRGAPWSQNTSWQIVLGEGIVAVIVGLVVLLQPLGVSTTLQIVGFALLAGAALTAFQIWRGRVEPGREVLAAFRAGSGVTVGLVVIVATFFTAVTETVTASLAVVVGVGFIVFGLAGIAASYVGRRELEPLPMAILVANAALVVAGIVLMLSGAAGSGTVGSVFNLLGVAFIVAGLGLTGYGYMLRQQEQQGYRR